MKKFTKLMLTLALLVAGVGGAKVYAAKTIGTEFTSVAALEGKIFAIVNKAESKAICNQRTIENDYDLSYLPYAQAFSSASLGYLFKIEEAHDGYYYIRSLKADGSEYTIFEWNFATYLQSHSADKANCCYFIFKDADGTDLSVWDIQYVENEGFTLKNVGTDKYYNTPTQAANSDTPGYFQFCEVVETNPIITIENSENLEEIAQEQNQEENETIHKASISGPTDGITTYTTTGDICIIVKTFDVNVANCDYITYKFAEPIPAGIQYAVWAKEGNKCEPLAEGITEFKYVFANDPSCAIDNNVIPQVCLLTVYAQGGKVVKVKGIYKHQITESTDARTYSFNQALDFTDTGLEAYVISAYDKSSATLTLTKVTKVPANTGLYLVGKDGDYEIPTIASADAIATNLLHASSGTDALEQTEGSNTNLIFGGTGDNRGFHPLSEAGVIGANKAYLQLPTADLPSNGARLNIVFEDGTTAIKTVNDVKVTDNAWYDLQGRRVAQPTKGLYIQNSKKVLVK